MREAGRVEPRRLGDRLLPRVVRDLDRVALGAARREQHELPQTVDEGFDHLVLAEPPIHEAGRFPQGVAHIAVRQGVHQAHDGLLGRQPQHLLEQGR